MITVVYSVPPSITLGKSTTVAEPVKIAVSSYGWSFQMEIGMCAQCTKSRLTAWPNVRPPRFSASVKLASGCWSQQAAVVLEVQMVDAVDRVIDRRVRVVLVTAVAPHVELREGGTKTVVGQPGLRPVRPLCPRANDRAAHGRADLIAGCAGGERAARSHAHTHVGGGEVGGQSEDDREEG